MTHNDSQTSPVDNAKVDSPTKLPKQSPALKLLGGLLLLLAFCSACTSGYWFYQSMAFRSDLKEMKAEFDSAKSRSNQSELNGGIGLGFFGLGGLSSVDGRLESMERAVVLAGEIAVLTGEKRAYQYFGLALLLGFPGYGLFKHRSRVG